MPADPRLLGPVRRVPLDRSGRRWALLREPTGFDEQGVGAAGTLDAVRLLDRLLVDDPDAAACPGDAASLPVPERDLLLAAAWRMAWGPRIDGTITCDACGSPFDFDFTLDDLTERVLADADALPVENGVFTLPGGTRFRLPTARDEVAVLGVPEAEAARTLLARCLISGDLTVDGPVVEEAMERVGSGVDVDITAGCPECGHAASVRFQMQAYLLGAIAADGASLVDDVHRIALAYRWSLGEILSLPRGRRRAFVGLLDGEPAPAGVTPEGRW